MIDPTDKVFDRLSNEALNKLQKSMYRAVDLMETFFPDPDDVTKKIEIYPQQADFIDTVQYGFPLSRFKFSEIAQPPKGVIEITRRQVGKSISCGYTAAALMIIGPTSKGVPPCFMGMIAASEEESYLLLDKTKYAIENSDFNDFIVGRPKLDKIKLANKSFTKAHTCSHKSVRGAKYHYVFADEGALMDESIFFSATIPTVTHGERWILITTPQGSRGKLVEMYMDAVQKRPIICCSCGAEFLQSSFHKVEFPDKNKIWEMPKLPACKYCNSTVFKYGSTLIATPWLDPWQCPIIDMDDLKRQLDFFNWSPWVRQELLGEIIDEASMVILKEWIDNNTNDKLRNKAKAKKEINYVLGVDYGRLHDATCFCVTHRDQKTKRIVLDYMKTIAGEYDFDTDYAKIREQLKSITQHFNPTLIVPDATGAGYSQVEQLKKDIFEWGCRSKIYNSSKDRLGFIFSKQTKQDLIGNLIALLSQEKQQLEIPPQTEPEINELVTEMLRFECEVMEGGYIKYGTQPYHDDRLVAYALSLWGHRNANKFYRMKPKGFDYNLYPKKVRQVTTRTYRAKPRLMLNEW